MLDWKYPVDNTVRLTAVGQLPDDQFAIITTLPLERCPVKGSLTKRWMAAFSGPQGEVMKLCRLEFSGAVEGLYVDNIVVDSEPQMLQPLPVETLNTLGHDFQPMFDIVGRNYAVLLSRTPAEGLDS